MYLGGMKDIIVQSRNFSMNLEVAGQLLATCKPMIRIHSSIEIIDFQTVASDTYFKFLAGGF